MNISKVVRFLHYYRRNRYAEAVSLMGSIVPSRALLPLRWSYYRLGMYDTVCRAPRQWFFSWKDQLAIAVSLAACGEHQGATEAACSMVARFGWRKDFYRLSVALAPYMPDLALRLLRSVEAPLLLKSALLQANGYYPDSLDLLKESIREGLLAENPEIICYWSNADAWSPQERLDFLNSFLASHSLSPVALQSSVRSLGPHNLVPDGNPSKVKNGPLVSILMTTYQGGKYVDAAIESVLHQSWESIELIIVDDASTDATPERLASWVLKDSRIRLVVLPRNVGTYVAKNIALGYAGGEFVTCHDSDDWSHPLKIERQVMPLIKDRKLVCTTSEWVRMQDDGMYYARPVHPLQRLNPSSPLFRRKVVLEKTGGWDCVRTGADSEFHARLKLVFGNKAVLRIKQPLSLGSHRPNSLMTDPATGFTSGMVPPVRQAYWEAWNYWHIGELRAKRTLCMPGMSEPRVFEAPEEIMVPKEDIELCMRDAGIFTSVALRDRSCA